MVLTSDHITGATGKTVTVTLLKNGETSFAAPSGTVSELGSGWYSLSANATDANTLGPLLLHATATGCDPRDDTFTVVNYNPSSVDPISPPTTASFGTISARQIINNALTLIGVTAQGETLTSAEAQDGFRRLNMMIDAWGADSLTMLVTERTVFDLVASQQTYTLGTGGDWDMVRPSSLQGAGLVLNTSTPAVEIPLGILDDNSYEAIGMKTMTNSLPTLLYYNPTFPLGTIFLWPNPTDATNDIAMYAKTALTGFADLSAQYAFPPSYLEAIEYNLAARLSVPYGRALQPDVEAVARTSLARLKRVNSHQMDVRLDLGLTPGPGRGWYNIYTDTGA